MTIDLQSAAAQTAVQLTVGPDTSQATDAINSFVSDYNTLIGDLNTQFTVDPTSNTEGPLAADASCAPCNRACSTMSLTPLPATTASSTSLPSAST